MSKQYILIVAEGCHGCAEAKAKVKGNPNIRVADIQEDDLAADIVKSLGITAVPTVVEWDENSRKACVLDKDFNRRCAMVDVEA